MPAELCYSLPGFGPDAYENAGAWLLELKRLGFPSVAFTPTYLVHDEVPLRIAPQRGPSFTSLAQAIGFALEAGLKVQVDPHLDWESTLTGGPYEWRRRMFFDPLAQYFEEIIAPISGILAAAAPGQCSLTLGSELDVSLIEFAPEWRELARALRTQAPGVELGHKLNGDTLDAGESIRTDWNKERERRGLGRGGRREYRDRVRHIGDYLGDLDFVSFSFYPPVPPQSDMPEVFRNAAERLRRMLNGSAGNGPRFRIGEFGLGSADTMRPWEFATGSFNPELRRRYYRGLLESGIPADRITFWTVAQYDVLGLLDEKHRDDDLRHSVEEYNREA